MVIIMEMLVVIGMFYDNYNGNAGCNRDNIDMIINGFEL